MTGDRDDLLDRLADLERVIGEGGEAQSVAVVWRDPQTGDLVDRDGEPVAEPDADLLVVIAEAVVMPRERAEREGRAILGPADDTAESGLVRVPGEEQ